MRAGRAVGAVALMLAGVLTPSVGLDAQTVTVGVGDGTLSAVPPGAPFTVPVHVDMSQAGGLDVASLTFTVTWDPARVTYQGSAAGPVGTPTINEGQTSTGQLDVSWFNPTGVTNSFDVITIDFGAGVTEGTTTIDVQVSVAADGLGQDISGNVGTASLALCIGSDGLWGDVTGDGAVNIIDAQQVARFSVGLPVADPARMLSHGDVTADGSVNIIDAQQIARFSVGLPAAPRTGQPKPGGCTGPIIELSPSILAFQADLGSDPSPPTAVFTITNTGNETLDWTSVVSASWITIVPTSGSVQPGQSANVTVTISSSGLAAGSYDGTIDVIDPNAANSPQTVTVSLVVKPGSPVDLVCGELLSDAIAAAGQVRLFTLYGNTGAFITLTLVETSDWGGFNGANDARMTLLSPSGLIVGPAFVDSNVRAGFTLPEDGIYTVRVGANNSISTGTFNLGHECILPTDPVDGVMVPGDLVISTIDEAGEIDQYTFEGSVDEFITLTLVETTNWGGFNGANDAQFALYAPDGTFVSAHDSNTRNEFTLPQDGTYIVQVYANTLVNIGGYNLGLEAILPTDPVDGVMVPGDLVISTIDEPGEIDQYTFEGSVDEFITLTLVETTDWGGFNGANDAQFALYAPDGTFVSAHDSNTRNEFTLPQDGTYIVQVYANTLVNIGGYNLGLEAILPTDPVDGVMVPGDLVISTIDEPGEIDQYTFEGSVDEFITLTLVETTNWGGFNGANDAQFALYAPDGTFVSAHDSNTRNEFTLPQDGTYIVQVYANTLVNIGGYNLGLEAILPTDPVDGVMVPGDLVISTIDEPGEIDQYTFEGSVDEFITLTLVETTNWGGFNGANDAQFALYAPDGTFVSAHDSNTRNEFTLPQDGTYIVQVYANTLINIGGYNLGLEAILPTDPVDGVMTCNGNPLSASIDDPGEIDQFTFAGTDGQVINFTLAETTNWGGFNGANDARGQLYGPGGPIGGAFDSNGTFPRTLVGTGTFTLQLFANTLVSTGGYNLACF